MSKTFDQSKDEIARLCQYFTTNRKSFLATGVKEAHVRQSLIDPFFEILGWDMRNASMVAPQFREVVTEDSLDIEGQQKAPDYTFRLGTLPKYYVEAKKCGINISADPAPAYQLRRYGFSAKLPLSILTDFEELGVYDCASRPRPSDKASHGRVQYFEFAEYPDRWHEIWDIFSREAIWSGAFDQHAASKRKRGTSEVDSEFLKDIEGWRDSLARNIALRNLYLDHDDLNNAVQRTIDRIIFLRMAEDRKLETYGQLLKLCDQPGIYSRFMKLCQKADEKYNSGIFHFQKEAGVTEEHDRLTPALAIDDKVLKPILQSIYFEHGCPYHFGVLPVEILGTVYERFLGKVIRLTAGHQAKVEEKPEVRKAGGVYYTPAYIVNYIVLNTIGKQVEGKSPTDLAGGKTKPPFRVLDMACGSGSFLLGAYQFLLDHCLKWYQANPSKKCAGAVYQNAKGETCLSIAERKRILTTHIFGVDIDRQAVETTKLSLLLKALEGESDTTLSKQLALFHERALPNLSDNIKCGNSLIASDFSMHPEDLVRVNAFDWPAQFPDAMKAGGFDAIIGNPPYVRPHNVEPEIKKYFWAHFKTFVKKSDLYCCFIEQGISLLHDGGTFGFIVSDGWLRLDSFQELRQMLLSHTKLQTIIDFTDNVFEQASVKTLVMILARETSHASEIDVSVTPSSSNLSKISFKKISQHIFADTYKQIFDLSINPRIQKIKRKVNDSGTLLGQIYELSFGLKTGDDNIFLTNKKKDKSHKPLLRGANIHRYLKEFANEYVWYVPDKMREHRKTARPGTADRFEQPKVLIRDTGGDLEGTYDDEHYYVKDVLVISLAEPNGDALKYLCGILNSRLMKFYYEISFPTLHVQRNELASLPIHTINFTDSADKAMQNRLVDLVDKMLVLSPKLRGAISESEKAALQNAVTTTDAEIDRLVYELYGLTEEEIKIIEGDS